MPCKVYQCEDIESQTFRDNSFDIVIMQDVFEHLFNPMKAFQEVERTLKINGSLIMTVPLVKAHKPTQRRAQVDSNGNTLHILEPEYHGNPIDPLGALVTFDWGYDIVSFAAKHTSLNPILVKTANANYGIIGDLTEVFIATKSASQCPFEYEEAAL